MRAQQFVQHWDAVPPLLCWLHSYVYWDCTLCTLSTAVFLSFLTLLSTAFLSTTADASQCPFPHISSSTALLHTQMHCLLRYRPENCEHRRREDRAQEYTV